MRHRSSIAGRRFRGAGLLSAWAPLVLGAVLAAALADRSLARTTVPWIVDAAHARSLIAAGAVVLDARAAGTRSKSGAALDAVAVDWRRFAPTAGQHGGKLLEPATIGARLRALGVSYPRPVIVVGDARRGWGEDGRLVWMLRSLGHDRAALVDGGQQALLRGGDVRAERLPVPGNFKPRAIDRWTIGGEEVRRRLADANHVFIDARERREYRGATPYGESRGGHLPGAIHLHHRELVDGEGRLLPTSKLRRKLRARGIRPSKTVIAYCTGGVRSAWLVAVLVHLGYPRAKNYAGSMWEWSARPTPHYPLERLGAGER